VLLPAHIAFLELIIDPACSTVFEAEPEEQHIMERPPRNMNERLFGRKNFMYSFLQGISVLIAVLFVFLWFFNQINEDYARTLSFCTLVIANLMLILVNLSSTHTIVRTFSSKNKALWFVMIGALFSLVVIIWIPLLRTFFHFSAISFMDFLIAAIIGVVSVSWFKIFSLRKKTKKSTQQ